MVGMVGRNCWGEGSVVVDCVMSSIFVGDGDVKFLLEKMLIKRDVGDRTSLLALLLLLLLL